MSIVTTIIARIVVLPTLGCVTVGIVATIVHPPVAIAVLPVLQAEEMPTIIICPMIAVPMQQNPTTVT
jgi:hypothetical protein